MNTKGWKRGTPRYFVWGPIEQCIVSYDTNYLAARSTAHRKGGMVIPIRFFKTYAAKEVAFYGELGVMARALKKKLRLG